MRNPWFIAVSIFAVFAFAFFSDRAPDQIRLLLRQLHADKLLHVAAGYLIVAVGVAFLGIHDSGILFLLAISVGAGWEVMQHATLSFGVVVHEDPHFLGRAEPYADLVADIVGAFLYWMLHIAGKPS